jgi:uncharacterized membrane protein YhaH (DUF805 family)
VDQSGLVTVLSSILAAAAPSSTVVSKYIIGKGQGNRESFWFLIFWNLILLVLFCLLN